MHKFCFKRNHGLELFDEDQKDIDTFMAAMKEKEDNNR